MIQLFSTKKNLVSAPFQIRWVGENSGLTNQSDELQAERLHIVRISSGVILFMNSDHEFLLLSINEK